MIELPNGDTAPIVTLDAYQEAASTFITPTASREERVFGLWEEAGEVGGIFKRLFRGDYSPDVAATKLHKELGDCLWYLSQIARDNGFTLSEIATENIRKLADRKARNVLKGEGDNR